MSLEGAGGDEGPRAFVGLDPPSNDIAFRIAEETRTTLKVG